jgi:hypothetical protein
MVQPCAHSDRNTNEVSFKTVMLTGLGISKDVEETVIDPGAWQKKKYKRPKTVLEAKLEICRKLQDYDCPPYNSGEVMVELTHKNMGDIAKLIKKYKDVEFRNFDKALTVWMRQSKHDGKDDRGLWDRLTSAPRVGQQL